MSEQKPNNEGEILGIVDPQEAEYREYVNDLASGYLNASEADRDAFWNGYLADLQARDDRHAAVAELVDFQDRCTFLAGAEAPDVVPQVDALAARKLLSPADFAKIGDKLGKNPKGMSIDELADEVGVPEQVVRVVVAKFSDAGLTKYGAGDKVAPTAKAKGQGLSVYAANNTAEAKQITERRTYAAVQSDGASLSDVYRARASMEMDKVRVTVNNSSVKTLYASELLIGHRDSAVDFYEDTINKIKDGPESMKPDVVVMTGLVQGNFQLRDKRKQAILVDGLQTLDAQFRHAKGVLDKTAELGVPIVYNLSDDDRRIADQETIFRIREITKDARDTVNVTYYQADQVKQNPIFKEHFQFYVDVVMPYCIKNGRNLRRAGEESDITGDILPIDEYYALYNAYQDIKMGLEPDPYYAELVDIAGIRIPGEQSGDLMFVDDAEITLTTEGAEYVDHIRHSMQLSRATLNGNHADVGLKALQQIAASGEDTPDTLINQGGYEGVSTLTHQGLYVATAGLLRAGNMWRDSGTRWEIQDTAQRTFTTRKRQTSPGMETVERTDDGRILYTIYNEKLMEKSHSLPERLSIVVNCDWQTGSPTARPELQVKWMDYTRTRVLGQNALAIIFAGDNLHGRNYPDFPNEGQFVGLLSMDSQQEFLVDMIERELENYTPEEIKGLDSIRLQIGNHEWNSGTYKWHGDSFVKALRMTYENLYRRMGYNREQTRDKVSFHNALATTSGDYLRTYSTVAQYGDYGVLAQHFAMDRGAKGNTGGLPVYQSVQQSALGELVEGIDVKITGHWHHPQKLQDKDTIAVVNGSLAGLSGYELMRGYRPVMGSVVIHIGGGKPPQVEIVTEEALLKHKITKGEYSDKALKAEGYTDDRNFDPKRHGIHMPNRYPKSALQKKILDMERAASQYDSTHGMLGKAA